jgi:hypothetical protein
MTECALSVIGTSIRRLKMMREDKPASNTVIKQLQEHGGYDQEDVMI